MIWAAVGLVLLGVVLARAAGRLGPRMAARVRARRGAPALLAAALPLIAILAALVLAVRGAWPEAAVLVALGLFGSLAARTRGASGRRTGAAGGRGGMDLAQAASLLGVAPDASPATVQAAYLRLMRMAHPDRGGTSGLAAQLNAAREAMLARGRRS